MNNNFYKNIVTFIPVKETVFKLKPHSTSFFIGSCFATNLCNKFKDLYLNSTNSPFGNIYNPSSLGSALFRIIDLKLIKKEECIKVDGLYQHFAFHSKCGDKNLELYTNNVNNTILKANKALLESELLIITLGSAYVFVKDDIIVNNCHKLPKEKFTRRALTINEIVESILPPLKKLKEINSKVNIVITLSPIRHLRDNPEENSFSKALLRVAIEEIITAIPSYYFPSYEILLDELRDYRWYDKSLNHPNNEAIDYITSKFIDASAGEDLKIYIKRVEKLILMLNHKIINYDRESSVAFIKKRDTILKQLQKDYMKLSNLQNIKSYLYL